MRPAEERAAGLCGCAVWSLAIGRGAPVLDLHALLGRFQVFAGASYIPHVRTTFAAAGLSPGSDNETATAPPPEHSRCRLDQSTVASPPAVAAVSRVGLDHASLNSSPIGRATGDLMNGRAPSLPAFPLNIGPIQPERPLN